MIDTHPIKIKYQNHTRTYRDFFPVNLYGSDISILVVKYDDDDGDDGKDRVFSYLISVKSRFVI